MTPLNPSDAVILADWLAEMCATDEERDAARSVLDGTALDRAATWWGSVGRHCNHPSRGGHSAHLHRMLNSLRADEFGPDDVPF